MDKKELQKKLNQPYSTANWREVVQFVFPNVSLRDKPADIPVEPKFQDIIESFKQLGDVKLHDGKTLALLELKVKENVNIIKNRVKLNEIVSSVIDTENANGVLSIFEKGTDDYRFTFSARSNEFDEVEGDFVTKKTDTKRFTYVLGKNESCKTPAQRFYELSENKNKVEIKDIENAFSVEKLSKAFFKEYKDQYTAFVNYMMQTPGIFTAIYSQDDKAIRDFVKILLGRIIFIKFVQKKGWMGVDAASNKWIDGDYRFLENGFANFKHQDLFYSTFLEPLFEALDESNRPNDIFSVTNTRVPYLSGGLFELDDKKTKNINFPVKYFADLFEFLDRYNFTIDENDTNDHEVGIDPEMLGHIFENLLEDNKDKGAFYTPKEIVRYMCQESLKEYLKTSLENNKQWPTDENKAAAFEQALHNFVTKKEAGGIIEFEETIARALKEVKICDPAIGSGAFPMGLLNEIFQLVHKLHEANRDKVERVWELKGWQPNLVKQNIIQNSIYGVDIEKGAVDVARLRFWLSLIVDEPEPRALPHLDYKIVVGNSLVSKLDDTIIDIDWDVKEEQTDLFGNENKVRQQQLLNEISAKQKLVFDPNSDEEKLSLQIRNLKIDLLVNQLDAMVKTKGVATKPTGTSKTIKAQTELWLQTLGWIQQIEKLQKLKKDSNGILHFFDWKLDFPEIMSEEVTKEFNRKVGFDIVIANPPYLKERDNAHIFNSVNNSKLGKNYHQGKMDFWYYFLHLGLDISSNKSAISFITSRYWINSNGAKKLIERVHKNLSFVSVVDIGKLKVFDNVAGHHMIHNYSKVNREQFIYKKISNDIKVIELEVNSENQTISKLKNKEVFADNEIIFASQELKSKFELTLNDKYILGQGVVEASDKISSKQYKKIGRNDVNIGDGVFVLTESEKNNLNLTDFEKKIIVKYIDPNDVKSYYINPKEKKFLIYSDKENKELISNNKNYSNIKRHLDFYSDYITSSNKPYGLHRHRDINLFKTKKILFKGMFVRNECAIDVENYFVGMSFISIIQNKKHKDFSLEFLLGVLNSKYALNWFNTYGKKRGAGVDIGVDKLRTFPMPLKVSKKIEKIVEDISIKKKTNNIDTTDLEHRIDNLVYKLYALTYDEVLVVEPEFSQRMSRKEYEVLKVE